MDIKQIEIYKLMTPETKLRISLDLYYSARQIKAAAIKSENPEWDNKMIEKHLRELFFYART